MENGDGNKKSTNLGCYKRASGVYYIRYIYPKTIRDKLLLRQREFRVSLKTKHHLEAKKRAVLLIVCIDDVMKAVNKVDDVKRATRLFEEGMNRVRGHHVLSEGYKAVEPSLLRLHLEDANGVKEWSWEKAKEEARNASTTQPTYPTQPTRDTYVTQPTYPTETMQATYPTETAQPTYPTQPTETNEGITFGELARLFLDERESMGVWVGRTLRNRAAKVESIVEVVGADKLYSRVTPAEVFRIRDLIYRYPKNRRKQKGIRDMSLSQIYRMPEGSYTVLDVDTANSYIGVFKDICKFAVPRFAGTDVSSSLTVRKVKKVKSKRKNSFATLSRDDLKAAFETHYYKGGRFVSRISYTSDKFWLPLMAMFSGARVGELIQLRVKDVVFSDEHELWYFDLNDEDDGKTLKTENSRRWVPIHSRLISMGAIDFFLSAGKPDDLIFPDIAYFGKTDDTNSFSKWFERTFRKEAGWSSANRQTFHSFRHTFVDNLRRQANLHDWQIASIVGHLPSEDGLTTVGYGSHEITLSDKRDMIEMLDYGVDLSHLSWSKYQKGFLDKQKKRG